jgi:ankyrin repeat domain-containing protein 50
MAEVATLIQLIQFSGAVVSACCDYISKVRSASSDIERVLSDVSVLETILKRLQLLISNEDDQRHALVKSLARPHGPFDLCYQALEELQKRLKLLTDASSTRRKLLWPIEEKRILEIQARLTEQKQTFLLALAGDTPFHEDEMIEQGRVVVDKLEAARIKDERSKILSWLSGADPSTNYNLARKRHEKGTGEWLLRSKEFQAWEESSSQIMWLRGLPGAGKTILRFVLTPNSQMLLTNTVPRS